ncbi:MAG: hypothetical protein QXN55_09165 [Candidatus Nitrosotenuis sp.]
MDISSLLQQPCIFDIIISDFGRESAIEFIRSLAIIEKRIIHTYLDQPDMEFYDEYRRIMFVFIGDIAYFKRAQIERYRQKGYLDERILLGIGDLEIPDDIRDRLIYSTLEQIYVGLNHGYDNIRIVIPCNTLSPLGFHLRQLLLDKEQALKLLRTTLGSELRSEIIERLKQAKFSIYTVPTIVLDEITKSRGTKADLLVLGTTPIMEIYKSEVDNMRLDYKLLELSKADQTLINRTVVAAIDGDASVVRQMRQRIDADVINPRKQQNQEMVVVEACTDFDLALGINSREVFVHRLVYDAYGLTNGHKLHMKIKSRPRIRKKPGE